MKYKVLAFDIDGTLTNSQKKLEDGTKKAILEAADKGCTIAIATGRPVPGVKELADELCFDRINGYVISLNGGLVMSWKDKKTILEEKIPVEYNPIICDLARRYPVTLLTYLGDNVITENPDDKFVEIETRINKIKAIYVSDLKSYINFPVPKFLMVGDGDKMAEIEKEVKEILGDILDVYRSEPFFLEILPKGINKAKALEILLNKVGAQRDELMAFGDGYNDISMIEYAGMGVAMANGNEIIKEKADYIAPSNDEGGIEKTLKKFVLD